MKRLYKAFIATITQVILTWSGYFLDKIEPFRPAPDIIPNITGAGIAYTITWLILLAFLLCWIILSEK